MSDVPNGAEDTPPDRAARPRTGGVQSLERAFGLLELVATNRGAMSLSELATASGLAPADPAPARPHPGRPRLPAPGALASLRPRAAALPAGREPSTMLNSVALPHLGHLVDEIGETANLAMLDGDQVAYVAQAPGRHAMRMFTEVGRRVLPHCTAVGKALLATAHDDDVRALLSRTGLPRHTPHTVTDPEELLAQLELVAPAGTRWTRASRRSGSGAWPWPSRARPSGWPCPSRGRRPG